MTNFERITQNPETLIRSGFSIYCEQCGAECLGHEVLIPDTACFNNLINWLNQESEG